MESLQGILKTMEPTVLKLERLRRRAVVLYLASLTLTILTLACVLYFTSYFKYGAIWQKWAFFGLTYGCPIALLFAHFFFYHHFFESYKTLFKQTLLPLLVQGINPKLRLLHDSFIPRETFEQGYIQNIANIIKSYGGCNLFSGTLGVTPVQFSELRVHYQNQRHQVTAPVNFLFFQAKLPAALSSSTYVSHGQHAGSLAKVLAEKEQDLSASDLSLCMELKSLNLRDQPAAQELIVLGNDAAATQNFLSAELVSRLLQCKNGLRRSYAVFFTEQDVYMTFVTPHDLFRPPFFRSASDLRTLAPHLQEYYWDVAMFLEVLRLVEGQAKSTSEKPADHSHVS